jgi:hypothetical protein
VEQGKFMGLETLAVNRKVTISRGWDVGRMNIVSAVPVSQRSNLSLLGVSIFLHDLACFCFKVAFALNITAISSSRSLELGGGCIVWSARYAYSTCRNSAHVF